MPCIFDSIFQLALGCKKSLIITKLYSEAVIEQGQTIKRPKKKKKDKTLQKKPNIEQQWHHKKMELLRCSGRTTSRYSTIETRRVILIFKLPVINHLREDEIVTTTNWTNLLSSVAQIFCKSRWWPYNFRLITSSLVATLYTTITKRCCIFHTFKKDVRVWFNMLSFHFILINFVGTDQFSFRFNFRSVDRSIHIFVLYLIRTPV